MVTNPMRQVGLMPVDADLNLDWPPPKGHTWEWVPDPDWRLQEGRECRRMGKGHELCRRPSVAALNRSALRRDGRQSWWAYCELHLYGCRIVDGVVLQRRAIPVSTQPSRNQESVE